MRLGTRFCALTILAGAAACSSTGVSGDPLGSPNTVTATLDNRPWTSSSVVTTFTADGGVFRLIATNPNDSLATQVKIVLVQVPFGAGTYDANSNSATEEVTPRIGAVWSTATAPDGCGFDCTGLSHWGTITFTRFDYQRAIGTFTINPSPHHTSGTFDVILH